MPGDLVVWFFVGLELATFGLLFLAFAFTKLMQPVVFAVGQASLDQTVGAINTLLLISASACAAHTLANVRAGRHRAATHWLGAALLLGLGFLFFKSREYMDKWQAGVDFASNDFYMLWTILTGFHFMHVVAGCVIFALLLHPVSRGRYNAQDCNALESGCVFWHMVDLLWIVLFPLVYLLV
ncbi:cytochrome c oxidase subunit 3 [Diaphorobacter aerolatus]|uniref:cytochrome c oxidase subunit 3 n=1 Tax=Diaphorobacter aerolatus TaxID=1288495 RepID=UPI001D031B26|nr:cytochrome c oxidase subunit 3 [Diaphorobacter aerolatus]